MATKLDPYTFAVVRRPYLMRAGHGRALPVNTDDVLRLISNRNDIKSVGPRRLILKADAPNGIMEMTITPATIGGGPAFVAS